MITESILNIFLGIPELLIMLIPTTDIRLPTDILSGASSILQGIGYVVPIGALSPIFVTDFVLTNFKIIWALIIRVKSFIPTMGA